MQEDCIYITLTAAFCGILELFHYTTPSLSVKKGLQCLYTVILKGAMAENIIPNDPAGDESAHDKKNDDKNNTGNKPQEVPLRLS